MILSSLLVPGPIFCTGCTIAAAAAAGSTTATTKRLAAAYVPDGRGGAHSHAELVVVVVAT